MHIIRYICKTCSIRNILFAFMLIFSIIPTLIIYFCFKTYTVNIVADKYINEYLMSLSSQIDNKFSSFEKQLTSNYLYISLNSEKLKDIERNENVEKIMTEAFSQKDSVSYVQIITNDNVYTYSKDGTKCELDKEIDKSFFDTFQPMSTKIYDTVLKCGDKNYVVSGRTLFNYYNSHDSGYILFYTDERYINSLYKNLQTDNISCYIILNGKVISCADENKLGKELFIPDVYGRKGSVTDNLVQSTKIPGSFSGELEIMTVTSYHNLFGIINSLGKFNTIILIISLLLSLIISIIISHSCLKSIRTVNKNIELFANDPGNYKPKKTNGEIASFENRFNEMVIRIQDLMKKNEYEREKKHIAELCTLQSQIKHHFVYNALDIVCWKARETNQTEIEKIVVALASYFRISLSRGKNFITVRDEISLVKNYVLIEKMRFNDLFDIEFDVSEEILDKEILKIVLQPVIENCIKHGFKDIDYKGKILVAGKLSDDGTIVFDITDNGCGINTDTIENVFKNRHDKIGYGLYNIFERLHFEYGNNGKISFIDTNGNGTHVQISIKPI